MSLAWPEPQANGSTYMALGVVELIERPAALGPLSRLHGHLYHRVGAAGQFQLRWQSSLDCAYFVRQPKIGLR
jgi:hypothetical protein